MHNADLSQLASLGFKAMHIDTIYNTSHVTTCLLYILLRHGTIYNTNNIMNMPARHIAAACRLLVACTCESQPERSITMYMLVSPFHTCHNDKTRAECRDERRIGGERDT